MKTKTQHTPKPWGLVASDFHVAPNVGRPDKIIGIYPSEGAAWDAAIGCGECECGGPGVLHADDSADVRDAIARAGMARMKRRRGNTSFDMEINYQDHTLRVTGTATPYVPATGPSMENAGGDPPEGGEIEDLCAALVFERKDGTVRRRDLGEASDKMRDALEDIILERLSDAAADAQSDADEARCRRSRGE